MNDDAERASRAWAWPGEITLEAIRDGLINRTFLVRFEGRPFAVLQQLNTRIFKREVLADMHAVTCHLAEKGIATPRLFLTKQGALGHEGEDGVWRCMSHEGDRTIHKVKDPQDAYAAGCLAARFHGALRDFVWELQSVRVGVHDTPRHMDLLASSVQNHRKHRLRSNVEPLSEEILERWSAWQGANALPTFPSQIIHGDLKISNVRFCRARAHCLIDLDTVARDTLSVELGDALRSWCNPASEDSQQTYFDLGVFEAAMQGYGAGTAGMVAPSPEEWQQVVPGIERISLELAARFARDALEESYFGWNERFGSRGEHNLLRAQGQLALARSVRETYPAAQRIIDSVRRRP